MLQARRLGDMVEIAREHGARVHGFTPAWYSQPRLAAMAAVVARSASGRGPVAGDAHPSNMAGASQP
jgi:hypothetical protein